MSNEAPVDGKIQIDPQHLINAQRAKINVLQDDVLMLEALANQQQAQINELIQQLERATATPESIGSGAAPRGPGLPDGTKLLTKTPPSDMDSTPLKSVVKRKPARR